MLSSLISVVCCRFVHVLADAYPILTDPCLGLSSEYPWAMTIATAASLMAFTLEWVLHKQFHKKMNVLHAPNGELRQAGSPEPERDVSKLEAALPTTTPEQRMRVKALHNVVISYTFEIGIIFHSKLYLCPCDMLSGMFSQLSRPRLLHTCCCTQAVAWSRIVQARHIFHTFIVFAMFKGRNVVMLAETVMASLLCARRLVLESSSSSRDHEHGSLYQRVRLHQHVDPMHGIFKVYLLQASSLASRWAFLQMLTLFELS